eukprot:TRINITY_DN9207_c0_g1_i1.p1 TRINITY_DN9207_c0_g1~~TRINITY_DN9207_c0_g1_i1.p1  ORF type:complete len:144 (+),score=31.71 TRINITY_DN9207_c0_g1_i1:40-471(+)
MSAPEDAPQSDSLAAETVQAQSHLNDGEALKADLVALETAAQAATGELHELLGALHNALADSSTGATAHLNVMGQAAGQLRTTTSRCVAESDALRAQCAALRDEAAQIEHLSTVTAELRKNALQVDALVAKHVNAVQQARSTR